MLHQQVICLSAPAQLAASAARSGIHVPGLDADSSLPAHNNVTIISDASSNTLLPFTQSQEPTSLSFVWHSCLNNVHNLSILQTVKCTGLDIIFFVHYTSLRTAVAQWLRCCATNRKVAGSIPGGVIGIFH